MSDINLNYTFEEGIGGGEKPAYLLKLNGKLNVSYPKANFERAAALEKARAEVQASRDNYGSRSVTFMDVTN